MIDRQFNWRLLLAILAIGIVSGTIFYSQYLAKKIREEEQQKVEQWLAASKAILNNDLTLPNLIRNEQHSIPIIETNEKDSITNFFNLDSAKAVNDKSYLINKLKEFSVQNKPLEVKWSDTPYTANRYYYGHTVLLGQVRYYPLVQLCIVALFIFFIVYSITVSNRATQNQVWAGMAKETAHQLGTPISSLEGWIEMLKESGTREDILTELEKDVSRLKLVSDRFGKIGSTPIVEKSDIISQIRNMVEYIKKRTTDKVHFEINTHDAQIIEASISKPLFDWVIENLLKNALDAMEGKGKISVDIKDDKKEILIDVSDTGKGISAANIRRVFKPGFTTKKRGWGLGLSLSKRIIEQYHQGELFVKQSDLGKGTTFRIVLKKIG
ncbi:MAG: HAMP domain-containing histidine kinase [Bacteroidetes bacterium]|nr:HAMP domain-containing histidine kinase [Bacteroidota bacterium]